MLRLSSCIVVLVLSLISSENVSDAFTSPHSFASTVTTGAGIGSQCSVPFSAGSTSTSLFGIPKMFRWLTDQYPNINRRLSEGLTSDVRVDNFYLDMNGIIHPCTHGNAQDQIIVLDETAMFKKIFAYVDRYVPLNLYFFHKKKRRKGPCYLLCIYIYTHV